MAGAQYQVKSAIRESGDRIEEVVSRVRPLTKSDVNQVMAPLRDAEKALKEAGTETGAHNDQIYDLIRVEILLGKAFLALHGINQGTRGEPLSDYRGLTVEQKLEQIYRHITFAEDRLATIDPQVVSEYIGEPYTEIEESIFVIKDTVSNLSKEFKNERTEISGQTPIENIPLTNQAAANESSSSNILIGVVIAVIGIGLMATGAGVFIGIVLMIIGGVVMFPRLAIYLLIGLLFGALIAFL